MAERTQQTAYLSCWGRAILWAVGILLCLLWCQPVEPAANGVAMWSIWGAIALCGVTGLITLILPAEPRLGQKQTLLYSPKLLPLLLPVVIVFANWGSRLVTQHQLRLSINLSWNWISILLLMLILVYRPMIDRQLQIKLPVALLWFATALSGVGLYQHYLFYPQMSLQFQTLTAQQAELKQSVATARGMVRERYAQQLAETEQQMQQTGIPLDQKQQQLLKQRVVDSTEPFGFFGLANTFAGVLMLSVLAGLMLLIDQWKRKAGRLLLIVMLTLQGYTLLLTKSRSAWLGLFAGLLLIGLIRLKLQRESKAKLLVQITVGAAFGIVGMIGVLLLTGSLDWQVLLESNKSLQYRFEYWQGTLAMLRQYWLTGVGLGQFRRHYLQYKLPQSSEEILDPHNWLLELWSMGGIVGLVLGCAIVLCLVYGFVSVLWRSKSNVRQSFFGPVKLSGSSASWGGIACLILFFSQLLTSNGWDDQLLLCGLGLLSVYGLCCMMFTAHETSAHETSEDEHGPHSATGWIILALAMLVHLSAAGGAGMPGMMQWVLLIVWWAFSTDAFTTETLQSTHAQTQTGSLHYFFGAAMAFMALFLAVGFYVQVFRPVSTTVDMQNLQVNQKLMSLENPEAYSIGQVTKDEYDPEPLRFLARFLEAPRWKDSKAANEQRVHLLVAASLRDPRNAGLHVETAQAISSYAVDFLDWDQNIKFALSTQTQKIVSTQALRDGVKSFMSQAIELFPTKPDYHLDYGLVLLQMGDENELALQEIAEAIRLEQILEQAGHPDKSFPRLKISQLEGLLMDLPSDVIVPQIIQARLP